MAELVFIHGAGDSAAIWDKQAQHFGGTHRVLALDLPGHGQRLREPAFEHHELNADEVARQLRIADVRRPVLIGHSMGGAVVLSAALREPSLPRALVLVASGARLRMHPDFVETARLKAETAPPAQVAGPSVPLETAVAPVLTEDSRRWLRARIGQSTAQATYADFLANNRFDVMERLSEIRVPVLVIAGQDDRLTPPKYQTFLAERLSTAKLTLLPDAGHYVQVEQASAFNAELEQFLAVLPA